MILETAIMSVEEGREDEFLEALEEAKEVLAQAPGYQEIRALRGIERPSVVQLVIAWDTLDDHTVGFRGGELFGQWREILGPFFAADPEVEHWTEAVTPAPSQ